MGTLAKTELPACDGGPPATRTSGLLKLHLWAPAFTGFGGGISAFSRELAIGLKGRGHQLRLFGKNDRTGSWPEFQLRGANGYPSVIRTAGFAASNIAAAGRARPDQIISTHINFGPAAHLAKRLLGTPYSLVAHGIDVHPNLPPGTLRAMRGADRIAAVSSWTRQRVLDLGGIDPERVTILPNTVDAARFSVAPKSRALGMRYALRDEERVILTVARLAPSERYKGYDQIVRALPALRAACGPVRFILVGGGADRGRVEELTRELGVEREVTFTGFVGDDELADHYRLADVFAMPSTGEGFGIVFLEAMGCGTPVLAGNCDGSVDALDGGRLGKLVNPKDVHEIASGIISLLAREGPAWWFERPKLHDAMIERFGRAAFQEGLENALHL